MFRERCLDFDLLVLRQFWLAPEPPVRVAMLSLRSRKPFDRGRRGWVPRPVLIRARGQENCCCFRGLNIRF